MKVWIDRDELYPVFSIELESSYGVCVELDEETIRVCEEAQAAFDKAQDILDAAYDRTLRELHLKRHRSEAVAFVQRQRPWWSEKRCITLVISRERSGKPLMQMVAA